MQIRVSNAPRAARGLPGRHEIATALEEATGHRGPTTDFLSVRATDALMEAVGERVKGTVPQATWIGVSPLVFGGMAAWAGAILETAEREPRSRPSDTTSSSTGAVFGTAAP
jgi:hypothetical protein